MTTIELASRMTPALDTDGDSRALPIAIVGIGCRFPGGANDPDSFWKLLCNGVDAVTEIPRDRWNIRKFYHPDSSKPGKTNSRWGGFVADIDLFDAEFFFISAREAAFIDPQHRLLLEVAWEALEDGCQVVGGETGSDTGVFVGISSQDYSHLQSSILDQSRTGAYTNAGVAMSIAANRISHCLNLRGPSLAVDTACSSALVAVHLACRSLRNQECALALAGGVNLMFRAEPFIGFSKAAMLSPDGRCRSFSERANGYVRSEGAGMILLKPLSAALADGDPVYAVIRGTAVNEDGRTQGLSLPSGRAQEALVRAACRDAGVSPGRVQYVEAHGTGTAVGDPIEANALGAALSLDREAGDYCWLGSVKTNLGHLESAAGMPGVIKAALVLKNRVVPPNIHFERPNPNIDFDKLQLRVPTMLQPLGGNEQSVFAGVNSFGFGGANAHVVLESPPLDGNVTLAVLPGMEAPGAAEGNGEQERPPCVLLPLSADRPQALQAVARAYLEFLGPHGKGGAHTLRDVCYTASQRRRHHAHRLSVVGRSQEELAAGLGKFLAGANGVSLSPEKRTAPRKPKLAFVFGGQGPQWWGMGRELLGEEAVFREKIAECAQLLHSLGKGNGRSLWEDFHVRESESRMHEIATAHWAIFSLQVAIAALWRSWGIGPDVVVGHSIGEIAAAHVAGALSLADAARVIFHRGRCLEKLRVTGKMLAVGLSRQDAIDLVASRGHGIWLAAINSPSSVTLSGDAEALEAIARDLQQRQVFCKFLQVSFPYHSAYLDSIKEDFRAALHSLTPQRAAIPMISTVTGNPVEGPEIDAGYWWLNARHPVQFASAMSAMFDLKTDDFVEISPHPVLATSIHECLRSERREATVLASLRRGEPERAVMLASLGALYTQGLPVHWPALFPNGGQCVRLPAYPWQRERFWHEALDCRDARLGAPIHPLLSRNLGSVQPGWEIKLDTRLLPWIKDHQVRGRIVFPAAGYVEMALAAAGQTLGAVPCVLEEIEIQKPLFVQEGDLAPTLQFLYDSQDGSFRMYSRMESSQQPWTLHCLGKMRPETGANSHGSVTSPAVVPLDLWNRLGEEIPAGEYYRRGLPTGLHYGPSFRGLQRIRCKDGEALAEIAAPAELRGELDDYRLHPALLDSCFQLFPLTLTGAHGARRPGSAPLYLPVRIERVRFQGWPAGRAWGHVRLSHGDARSLQSDIRVLDDTGRPWIELTGFRCQPVGEVKADVGHDDCLYQWDWQLKPLPARQPVRRPADFLPNALELGQRLQAEAARLSSSLGWDQSWQGEVDGLCIAYIVRAIEQLGGPLRLGDRVTGDALLRRMGVVLAHERLVHRYLTLLEEEGLLRRSAKGTDEPHASWEVARLLEPVDIERSWRTMPFEHSDLHPELTLIERCGRHLPAVLRGEADPLEMLMPGGSLATLEHLYDSSRSSRLQNTIVQKAVTAAVERLPEGRTLRILEIGAGTGGVTAHLLPKLPAGPVEYVFTDVSAFFLAKAEQRFAAYPFVQYRLLDIEKPPTEQGVAVHGFDLVIAANALHATADLRQALAHVQQVLAPDGWLILMEPVKALRWFDLVFGLMEGWWKFADTDLRPSHPLLALQQWHALLAQSGFREVASISDPARAAECELAVMLARGPTWSAGPIPSGTLVTHRGLNLDEPAPVPQRDAGGWLLCADGSGVARQLADLFELRGERCVLITAEEEVDAALDLDSAPCRGIIHLWSLDAPTGRFSTAALDEAQERGCHSVMRLVQSLVRRGQSPQFWLVTRGAQPAGEQAPAVNAAQTPLIGLGRVIINEHPELRCRMVDLPAAAAGADVVNVRALFEEICSNDGEEEIALRGEARYVPRLAHASLQRLRRPSRHRATSDRFTLESTAPGMLENLVLRQRKRQPPGPGEVEIEVCAAGLNFRDVMKALGIYPTDSGDAGSFGDECAGRIVAVGPGVTRFRPGDEVLAFGVGGLGSHLTTPEFMACHKPEHLSFEQAATIPIVFLTAEYALRHIGRIRPGERVLIHAAAGGVGLAALQIARLAGAEVFATAGSQEKREFLRTLGIAHVMDSRALDFAAQVREATGGEGVDIVLNSLAGPAIATGLSCLREYGRFLEIGKRDIFGHTRMDLHPFRNNLSLAAIDLASALQRRPDFVGSMLRDLMGQFEQRVLHPLPHRTFPISDIVPSMRHMAQARHTGKVVLSFQGQEVTPAPAHEVDEETRFAHEGTYLITGGLGGLGLAVAQWMVENGARHLVLIGRSGASGGEAGRAIAAMEKKGARVTAAQADVASAEDVARVLAMIAESLPPLRGVMHGAMVLDDGVLLQLNAARFRQVTAPKMIGAWNLHLQTLAMPLEFFVMFSSSMSLLGNPGQGNYAAANAFLDALAHHRRALGLPALTVNWGRLGDVGYVARHEHLAGHLSRLGIEALPLVRATEILGQLLRQQPIQIAAQLIDWQKLSQRYPVTKSSPKFAHLVIETLLDPSAEHAQNVTRDAILAAAEGARLQLVEAHLREAIGKVVGAPAAKIALDRPLSELGMDSLMAIELTNRLEADLGVAISTGTVLGGQNVSRLAETLASLLENAAATAAPKT